MKSNQKGFGVIEGLLAVIAIALVGFVGFYVYNANKETDKSNNAQSKAADSQVGSQNDAGDSKAPKDYVFKELGIKIKTSEGINDLTYKVDEGTADAIFVSTKSIEKLFKSCGASGDAAVMPLSVAKTNGKFQEEGPVQLAKQFKDFYITTVRANGGADVACKESTPQSKIDEINQKVPDILDSLEAAFKNAELAQ